MAPRDIAANFGMESARLDRFRGPDGGLVIKTAFGDGMANSRFRFDDESLWKKRPIQV
jgi:hypothetical protein